MYRVLLTSITLLSNPLAFAQSQCDCAITGDQCQARVMTLPADSTGPRVLVKADTQSCAVVDWSANGKKKQTTVHDDGEEVRLASAGKADEPLEVNACRVCQDNHAEKKAPARLGILAKCAFEDGTIVTKQLVEVDPSLSAEQKRAVAEKVCEPIMEAASAACDDLAAKVDALKKAHRATARNSELWFEQEDQLRQAALSAPAYCK